MGDRKKKRGIIAVALLLCVMMAGGFFVLRRVPAELWTHVVPGCWIHRLTGLYCTGCGMTRAVYYALNGQFYAAFRMNPFMTLLLPAAVVVAGVELARRFLGKPPMRLPTWLVWTIVGMLLGFMVLRNLPWAPFRWLAPTYV